MKLSHPLIATTLLLLPATLTASAQRLYVFRNDSTFNCCPIDTLTCITHRTGDNDSIQIWHHGTDTAICTNAIDSCVIRHDDFPILRFTLPDNPGSDWVQDKETYIAATLDIEGNGTCADTTGLQLTVKGRGNSTWGFPKKPMRLKLKSKTALCGLRKGKSFVLLADYVDNTLMRNATSLWLAQHLGMPFANNFMPCLVYVNGYLAGAYLLTEKIGISANSVDIDEDTGILFELSTEYDEPYKFRSDRFNLPVMVKDPDFDELFEQDTTITQQDRIDMWRADFSNAEKHATMADAFDYIDLQSFVDYMLIYNLSKNSEIGYPKSVYCHKTQPGDSTRYHFGPVWDFDAAYNSATLTDSIPVQNAPDGSIWRNALFRVLTLNDTFKEAYATRFTEFETEILPELLGWFDVYAARIEPLAKIDGTRWPLPENLKWIYRQPTFDHKEATASMRQWIIDRTAYLRETLDTGIPFD